MNIKCRINVSINPHAVESLKEKHISKKKTLKIKSYERKLVICKGTACRLQQMDEQCISFIYLILKYLSSSYCWPDTGICALERVWRRGNSLCCHGTYYILVGEQKLIVHIYIYIYIHIHSRPDNWI